MLFTIITLLVITCSVGLSFLIIIVHRGGFTFYMKQNLVYKVKAYFRDILKNRIPLILLNLIAISVGTAISFYFADSFFTIQLPLIWQFILQFAAIIFLDDTFYYFYHKLLHKNEFLFKTIHKIHHNSIPPFSLDDFLYASPLEWIGGAACSTICLVIIYCLFGNINAYVFWLFVAFKTIHEVDIHSGIKSIFTQYIPFWGTAEYHEQHHKYFNGNYSSMFTFWDKIFGTKHK